jgi:hypothetical protein
VWNYTRLLQHNFGDFCGLVTFPYSVLRYIVYSVEKSSYKFDDLGRKEIGPHLPVQCPAPSLGSGITFDAPRLLLVVSCQIPVYGCPGQGVNPKSCSVQLWWQQLHRWAELSWLHVWRAVTETHMDSDRNLISVDYYCNMTITMAAPSKAWTVFVRSNAGIVGSDSTKGMDVCVCLFCVCIVSCLAKGWSAVQGVLSTVLGLRNWSETKRFMDALCSKVGAKWEGERDYCNTRNC